MWLLKNNLHSFTGMKKWLSDRLDLSKREFNGLLVLLVLIVILKLIPRAYSRWFVPDVESEKEGERHVIVLSDSGIRHSKAFGIAEQRIRKTSGPNLFFFDPNTINIREWQQLGLSLNQAAAILKYRSKGGHFRNAEDLQKMYTISEFMYRKLLPYVRISQSEVDANVSSNPSFKYLPKLERELKLVELNTADSAGLDEIRGVGPAFARRILRYRERLGGFYKKEQLLEVYGLDSLKYEEIKNQVEIDQGKLKRININTADREEFKNHPYIKYKQVNAVIEYRKQHGNYSNIADLNKVVILDVETIERMAAYLIFE